MLFGKNFFALVVTQSRKERKRGNEETPTLRDQPSKRIGSIGSHKTICKEALSHRSQLHSNCKFEEKRRGRENLCMQFEIEREWEPIFMI